MNRFFAIFSVSMIFILFIFTASSAQTVGIEWTKYEHNPVLSGGAVGEWNRNVFMPCVLYNPDSLRYEMWFSATASTTPTGRPYNIGFATSPDGITWTAVDTAVLKPTPGTWDEFTVEQECVIRENGQYKMWYGGSQINFQNTSIGYATSTNGRDWIKYADNPVLGPGTAKWEAGGPSHGFVLPVTGGYKMWYTGWESTFTYSNIGYATSTNGIDWQRDTLNGPVLPKGLTDQWDDKGVGPGKVMFIDSLYCMWYDGKKNGVSSSAIGFAVSPDGIHWTKYDDPATTSVLYADSDPVMKPSPGEWDGDWLLWPSVMRVDTTLYMWYAGLRHPQSTYLWRIGYATMPVDSLINYIISDIKDIKFTPQPSRINLRQNYPNPFNPSTSIEFSLPKSEFVTLRVYNILGEEVVTLVSEKLNAGNYNYGWDATGFASGIYIYQLKAKGPQKNTVLTKKLVLLK